MPARRPLGLASIILGCLVATSALLGPWGLGVIRYRTSPTAMFVGLATALYRPLFAHRVAFVHSGG